MAGKQQIAERNRVKVNGKVTFTKFPGSDYPAISAVNAEKTSPPKIQFLIPR
jgi:hypothetical protein